jgi:transposase InsO family protein
MSRTVSPSTSRPYGLLRVAQVWGVSRATVYRQRRHDEARHPKRRPGPAGPLPDEELVGLLAPGRVGRPHGPKAHDGTIRTERVDVMWGTDLTSVMTGEGQAAVFVAVDHGSAECVGIHASRSADRFEALEPVKQAVRECFGAFAEDIAAGLRLRHDHGSQYVSHHFQTEVRFLGIESSPAFVREPEGNGCAERFIRVLKENLLWVRHFATVEELRLALVAFKRTYNQTWIIERHGYKTPAQVRAEQIGSMPMAA